MKAKVRIDGGIHGIFTIARKMQNYEKKNDGMFNSFILSYSSVKVAKSDLKKAYIELKEEAKFDGCYPEISKDKTRLIWDASKAVLIKEKEL